MVPDIIITDLQMPKMTGFELIRAVRAQPADCEHPYRGTGQQTGRD
jgi:YesN/AraC family two-component response regulator